MSSSTNLKFRFRVDFSSHAFTIFNYFIAVFTQLFIKRVYICQFRSQLIYVVSVVLSDLNIHFFESYKLVFVACFTAACIHYEMHANKL